MINPKQFEISRFRDGALCLSCGDDNETDLVFASGAMVEDDPDFKLQKEILEFIVEAVNKSLT